MDVSDPHFVVDGTIMLPWASMHTFLVAMQVNERTLSRGTCMTVSHRGRWFVVTNRHNVTGRDQYSGRCLSPTGGVPDRLALCLPTDVSGGGWSVHGLALSDADGRPTWTEHPVHGAAVDVVALAFETPPQARCFGALLDDRDDFAVEVGDPVHAIGYRAGRPMFSVFPRWIAATLKTPLADRWSDLPAFLIDGPTAAGSSGSPVLAYREPAEDLRRSDGSRIGASWASRLLGVYSGRVPGGSGVVWNLGCVRAIVDHALATATP